jgi:hypothetical protein
MPKSELVTCYIKVQGCISFVISEAFAIPIGQLGANEKRVGVVMEAGCSEDNDTVSASNAKTRAGLLYHQDPKTAMKESL